MPEALPDSVARHIKRVLTKRDRWVAMAAEHPETARGMNVAIALMFHEIVVAVEALASGDIARILRAHQALTAYSDED